MYIRDRWSHPVLFVEIRPLQLEHLDFDAIRQSTAGIRAGGAPGKYPGVSTGLNVHPLYVENEVLVLLRAAHHADRMTRADQHAVFDSPGIFGRIDVHPASEVVTVKQIAELWKRNIAGRENAEYRRQPQQKACNR